MTTTPQAALLISLKDSDFWPADMSLNKWADLVCDELRRLDAENQRLQALLAKLQPAQEPAQAGELPDEREAFERWWRQRQLLTFPKDYDQGRLDGWGSAYKPAAMEAWQAALSARKPLVHGDLNPDRIFGLADVHAEESQEDGRRIFDRDGLVGFAMDAARIGSYQAMDPLTKEQIKDLAQDEELLLICDGFDSLEDIVSVIERAHGIGLEVKP